MIPYTHGSGWLAAALLATAIALAGLMRLLQRRPHLRLTLSDIVRVC